MAGSLLNPIASRQTEGLWAWLEENCGLAGIKMTPLPHFSWQAAEGYNFNKVDEVLSAIAGKTAPFTIQTAGLRPICGCVRRALAELPQRSQEILVDVEVGGMSVGAYATKAEISSGNASVRLHRARRLLSATLRNICGTCSLDGCADCDCGHHVRS